MNTFDQAPPWFKWALHEVGQRELEGNRGPVVRRYISLAHAGSEGDAWCAIFVNAALEACKIPGSRSASSQSFRTDKRFIKLPGPTLGAITVFWRAKEKSGLGHVGFYRGERSGYIWTLGGNEGDMVQIEALPAAGLHMGLVGYYWPVSVAMPSTGKIAMLEGAPTHQTQEPKVT